MRKILSLMLTVVLLSSVSFAQITLSRALSKTKHVSLQKVSSVLVNTNRSMNTAVWSDDFSDASAWSLTHADTAAAADWVIGTAIPSGEYPIAKILSTTADNGFALFDSDALGGTNQEAYLTTANPIDLSSAPSVILKFESYCARFQEQEYVSISTDNATWTDFEVHTGLAINTSSSNPELVEVDITSVAANQSSVWVRFKFVSPDAGYAWMVDDVSIEMLATVPDLVVKPSGAAALYAIPLDQATFIPMGNVKNVGTNLTEDVNLTLTIGDDYNETVAIPNPLANSASEDIAFASYTATSEGSLTLIYDANYPNDNNPLDNTDTTEIVIGNEYRRHNNTMAGYVGIGNPGGEVGNKFTFTVQDTLTSIKFRLNGTVGDQVVAIVRSFTTEPGLELGRTFPVTIVDDSLNVYEADMIMDKVLAPGDYFIGLVEGEHNVQLEYTTTPYVQNTAWGYFNDEWNDLGVLNSSYEHTYNLTPVFADVVLVNNDVMASSIEVDDVLAIGDVSIVGKAVNLGSDTLTSFDVVYSVDGGAPVAAYTVTGINVVQADTFVFTHDVPYTAVAGGHTIELVLSNPNGVIDEDLTNNTMSKEVSVLSELVAKKEFYEVFTASTCNPCAQANPQLDAAFLGDAPYANDVVVIKYQVNWPGDGDPYFTQEVADRISHYTGVYGVPTILTDGKKTSGPDTANYALVKITNGTLTYDGTNNTVSAEADFTSLTNLGNDLFVQMALVERKTTGNVGTNGETEFHNVMMKFLPGNEGSALDTFVIGSTKHITASASLEGTNVEEVSDLRLVVWVEDNNTVGVDSTDLGNGQYGYTHYKTVYQSEYIDFTQDLPDMALTAINTVGSACGLPTDAEMKVMVQNTGNVDASGFVVKYSVDGTEVQTMTYDQILTVGESVEITFPNPQDFSAIASYSIVATVEFNGDVTVSNNSQELIVSNIAPVDAGVYQEQFTQNTVGWSIEDANEDDKTWQFFSATMPNGTPLGHGDPTGFLYEYNTQLAADDYLYSTCLNFEAGKTYALNFWHHVGSSSSGTPYPEKLKVLIGEAQESSAMTQTIVDLGELTNIEYEEASETFSVTQDGTYYIAFYVYSDKDQYRLFVDDISITDVTSVKRIDDNTLKIYPNPTTGIVKLNDVEGAEIVVYNIVGEIVYSNAKASQLTTIDLSSNNGGNYIVKVIKDNEVSTQKIVLTK